MIFNHDHLEGIHKIVSEIMDENQLNYKDADKDQAAWFKRWEAMWGFLEVSSFRKLEEEVKD